MVILKEAQNDLETKETTVCSAFSLGATVTLQHCFQDSVVLERPKNAVMSKF